MDKEKVQALREESELLYMLGMLLVCGVPILESLQLMGDVFPRFKEAFQTAHDEVRGGESLCNGLRPNQHLFSGFVLPLVDVGEETGDLDKMLIRASDLIQEIATLIRRGKEVPSEEIAKIIDFQALATLQEAGIPMLRSLRIIELLSNSPNREVWKVLGDRLEEGGTLSEAMSKSPDNFPKHIVSIIAAGESGGVLDVVLSRVAAFRERQILSI